MAEGGGEHPTHCTVKTADGKVRHLGCVPQDQTITAMENISGLHDV